MYFKSLAILLYITEQVNLFFLLTLVIVVVLIIKLVEIEITTDRKFLRL